MDCDEVTGCSSVQTPASHMSGFAVQSGLVSGAGGLQQSNTVMVRMLSGAPQ